MPQGQHAAEAHKESPEHVEDQAMPQTDMLKETSEAHPGRSSISEEFSSDSSGQAPDATNAEPEHQTPDKFEHADSSKPTESQDVSRDIEQEEEAHLSEEKPQDSVPAHDASMPEHRKEHIVDQTEDHIDEERHEHALPRAGNRVVTRTIKTVEENRQPSPTLGERIAQVDERLEEVNIGSVLSMFG